MEKKSNNSRDFILGLFTALGLDMLITKSFAFYFMYAKNQILSTTRIIAVVELLLYVIGAVLIYKKIDVSPTYKKWFMIVALIIFIGNLLISAALLI